MNAMLLAAGRGERLRPLTDHCPKPLIEVAGKPLIEHVLDRLAAAGVRHCVVNVNWLAGQITDYLQQHWRWDMRLQISHESGQRLETGGGIFQVLEQLGPQPFLVANADVYCDADLATFAAMAQHWPTDKAAHLLMVDNPEHNPQGDFGLQPDGLLSDTEPRLTYAGIGLLHPRLFAGQQAGRFALAPLLRQAIAQGQVSGDRHRGHWTDVGTAQRLEQLRQRLA